MAYTPEQLAQFRRMIDDVSTPQAYTDEVLTAYLDDNGGDFRLTAAAVWREKAAKYVSLVDIQEGTSRRSLSAMLEHALAMAKDLEGPETSGNTGSPMTRQIERV